MKPIEGNPTGVKAYRELLSLALAHKLYFGFAVAGMIVFAASDAAFAYMMKPLLDDGFIDRDPLIIQLIPIAIVLIFVVRMVAVFMRSYCMDYIGRSVINTLRQMMFDKLMTMCSSEYDQSSTGAIVTRFTYDVERIAKSVSTSLTIFIQDSLRILVLLAYMLWLNWQLTLIFLLAGPIVFLVVVKVSSRFRNISKNIQTSMGDVSQIVQEVIDANRIVKIFGGEPFERKRFGQLNDRNLKLHLKMSVAQSISMPLIQLIVAIAFAAIVAFATSDSMRSIISTGDFVSFIFAMTMLLAPMRVLSSINANIQRGIAAGESVFEFTSRLSEKDNGQLSLERSKGQITFDRVSMLYSNSEAAALSDISFDVAENETIAIVGRSGSGKSSLVNLLPRLYEIDSGQLLIDGVPVQQYKMADLRKQISYVGQDVRLFNDTIRNNIAYGVSGTVTDDEIIEAARQAFAWDFIQGLPDQLDTEVGERGVLLSGGQRQRIAIARALLKNAPILILDEATSALDTESERYIQRALEKLMDNRTTLVIAHRLSTIEHADRIMVLDQGKLVEQGSHSDLLKTQGVYSRLHDLQFGDGDASESKRPGKKLPVRSVVIDKTEINKLMTVKQMKRQGWWLWSMNPFAILLMPMSLAYWFASALRRLFYRAGLFSSVRLPVTTIVVGNITVGGNGKTPVVIALYQFLKEQGYSPAIITRGYKSGHENSVQIISEGQTNASIGDEANMMSEICRCPIGVGANRTGAAQQLLADFPQIDMILSDDGLQHYALKRDLEVAVGRMVGLGNGLLIPAGPLRETRSRLQSVDININRDSEQVIESLSDCWNLNNPDERISVREFEAKQVHAVAGIGFPDVFFSSLRQIGIEVIEHEFPDHHEYQTKDLDLKPDLPVLVTHKDAVKLRGMGDGNIWVVPLTINLAEPLQNEILALVEKRHHG